MRNPSELRRVLEKANLLPLERQAVQNYADEYRRQSGIDLWVVLSKENCEDPILKTLLTWDMRQARRLSILLFSRDPVLGPCAA